MFIRCAITYCVFLGLLTSGCGSPEKANIVQEEAVPQHEGVALKSHVAPESYRFDTHLGDARISATPSVDGDGPFGGKSYGQLDYKLAKREYAHTLFARTPCSLEYDVAVMKDARLETELIVPDAVPTVFRILVLEGENETALLEQEITQKSKRHRVAIDMSAWAGKEIRIRFEAESEEVGTVALWANPRLARTFPVTVSERPINVIWYVIDALRPANMSAYGYERETTPTVDAIAKEGVLFEWCFSPASWTVDSVSSFFTGLGPNAHDMRHNGRPLSDSMHVLPEILRDAGYSTGLFSHNPYLDQRLGFVRGFDVAHRYHIRGGGVRRGGVALKNYPINKAIAEFLEEHKESPQFLYVHTLEPHHPYVPPLEFRVFSQPNGRANLVDTYDSCIAWADANLGYIIEGLKESGLWDNTLLIVSADHGECLPAHDSGLEGHGGAPYLSRVRIPLVMRLPGIFPEALTVSENVQALDIPRTLFELLNIEPDPQFAGQSLMGLVNGRENDKFSERTIFASGNDSKWEAAIKGRWFYMDNDGTGELLDLWSAPTQDANVIHEHPDLAKEMLEETKKHRASEMEKGKPYLTDAMSGPLLDEETRKELEALGYVDN
jgi:arylsulfatase A-like enzyme